MCAQVCSLGHAEERLQFNRDIRPILFDACISCHGPDSASRQADLRLDRREVAIDAGAIVPNEPETSELIRRILSEDEAEVMPPPESKKVLTAEQKELLTRWVQEGAEYQPHWSLIPPHRPALPTVKDANWPKNAIDHFVAARLDAEQLAPAPAADRRTLARRVSLDLTGLPPTPEVVEAFVNDQSPDAYEKLVDKLLDSPQWGEHRARYWLDVARYADTHGIHFDNYREMWSYRDWVINAFNKNMPFDRFTIESLAGDLLPEATLEQQIGSGFNRCNITTNEGGAIDEEYIVLYARDRTETTAMAWLGLTVGCAVCHDHKFDPLSQREFYELSAFFNNTTQTAMDGNIKDTPPVVVVPNAKDDRRWSQLPTLQKQLEMRLDARRSAARETFETWTQTAQRADLTKKLPQDKLILEVPLDDEGPEVRYTIRGESVRAPAPATLAWRPGPKDRSAGLITRGTILETDRKVADFEKDQPWSLALWIRIPENHEAGAVMAKLDDAVEHRGWDMFIYERHIGSHLIHKWPQNALKVFTRQPIPADTWTHVVISYDGSMRASGYKIYFNGLAQQLNLESDTLLPNKSTRNEVPFRIGQRQNSSQVSQIALSNVRIYERVLPQCDVTDLASQTLFALLDQPPAERAVSELNALYDWWLGNQDEHFQRLQAKMQGFVDEEQQIKSRGTVAHVMQEAPSAPKAFILVRGEYDQRSEKVTPDTPDILPPFPAGAPHNRLGLAMWLVEPNHPLTARVVVNRFWQEVFGTGLVSTAGDFGVTGQLPSHPELLDWLAVEFRDGGWNVEQLFKLIVMSATYQQSAVATAEEIERDPENRLLARGPRYRMDAEMVRDYALAACGLLSPKIGGPSVKPYQPPGVWEAVAMRESNTHDYVQDKGEALYRRSMYTFWKRSAPPASMDLFNAPSRETCVMARERTNTPLQALVTLNDPQFIEAARHLAESVVQQESSEFEIRMQWLAAKLLARNFNEAELKIAQSTFDQLLTHYQAHADQAEQLVRVGETPLNDKLPVAELAAWTMTVNQLLNLDETLNK
jgi:hypothetical protein